MNAINSYYAGKGLKVIELGRPGRHEADYMAVDSFGIEYPVEEKRYAESSGGTSSWWSYWRARLAHRYDRCRLEQLSPRARGWVAVIDGQLRDWAQMAKVTTAHLAVERPTAPSRQGCIADDIRAALRFLASERRIACANHSGSRSGNYGFWEISFIGTKLPVDPILANLFSSPETPKANTSDALLRSIWKLFDAD